MPKDQTPEQIPSDLALIADAPPPGPVPPSARDALQREQDQLELEKNRLLVLALRHQTQEQKQNIEERAKYAKRTFWVTIGWLAIVAYAVFAQGFGVGFHRYGRFHLADGVMLALLTTATATIVGMFLVVLRYLFSKR